MEDCVRALMLAGESDAALGQVFFAAGATQHSIAEFAERVVSVVGRGRVVQVEWPADWKMMDVGDVEISNARIREALGWSPEVNLDEGLARTRDYFDAHWGA